ncbi:sigma-70 family RNA polymerase sigma factor [Undibacterium sp. Ji49W]|uniref:sigma-70 family RNA polymerase sigma factor n=1 Tax=Undibacterium sp. Ji49W TaxID=3413040 RepID=UPI003BF21D83
MISTPQTDEALMLLYCEGDLQAFRELYQRHSNGLYRFISWRSPRREWVDEIVQDSWAALHTARPHYTPLAGFRTYLYQIARNRLIDLLRQKEIFLVGDDAHNDAHHDVFDNAAIDNATHTSQDALSPEAALDKKQQADRLHAAIRVLPNDQKEALVLQQFNGLSLEEIAVITAVPVETVKSRLRYAMQKLRSQLHSQTKQGEPA